MSYKTSRTFKKSFIYLKKYVSQRPQLLIIRLQCARLVLYRRPCTRAQKWIIPSLDSATETN